MMLRSGEDEFDHLLKINVDKELDMIELPKEFIDANKDEDNILRIKVIEKVINEDLVMLGTSFNLTQEQVK